VKLFNSITTLTFSNVFVLESTERRLMMKSLNFFLLLLAIIVLPGNINHVYAQSANHVSIQTKLEHDTVQSGSSVRGVILVTIEDGWHVNSKSPSLDYLIPTQCFFTPEEWYILSDIRYPEGKIKKLDFSDDSLSLYEGAIPIFFTIQIAQNVKEQIDTLKGYIEVQACNNAICAAPSSIPFQIPITISNKNQSAGTQEQDSLFALYAPTQQSQQITSFLNPSSDSQSLLLTLLSVFLIGLALNLTPCVYPMLSVTVSLFSRNTEQRFHIVLAKALLYVLGMATMYSVLGVSAALGGGLFGSWLQSPYVLAGIGGLLFLLALSSFGLYQIQIPYWLTNKLGGTTGTGFISLYLSGLVVGLFAAPCVGPPVIALMTVVAVKGDPLFGFWIFFTLAIGLGFPYLILGTFSGLLRKIPRSGEWLNWVEHIFGVLLLAVSLFYFMLAFAPKYSAYVVPFALIAGGIYLGFIKAHLSKNKILRRIQWIFGIVTIGGGLWFAASLHQPTIQWELYSESALHTALKQGQPVIIDFYADWCIPCLELERQTFTDSKVIEATAPWKRLKVDLTHFDSPESETLRKQFNIAGVPTILFIAPDGNEAENSRIVGFVPPQEFLLKLHQATEAQ
jgi:thiol:disulfide interchange protein DsbD